MKKLKITLNGKSYEVDVEILKDEDAPMSMPFMPMMSPMPAVPPPAAAPSKPQAAAASGGSELTSPMNGVVIEILCKPGDVVTAGQTVIILEAMKMKTNIASSKDGTIASIKISSNDSVESGQVLLTYK